MKKENTQLFSVVIRPKSISKYKKGYPLIQEKDIEKNWQTIKQEDRWCRFVTQQGEYISTGYIGQQNKGIGWMLTKLEGETINQPFFENKLFIAKQIRQSFFQDDGTTAFRIFNGEGDGIGGFTIDLYHTFVVISWYNQTIYEKQAEVIGALKKVYPEVIGIYEKIRFPHSELPESQHVWGNSAPDPLLVKENGITYATYLNEGLMTGIFLDQKEVRNYLTEGVAAGKNVLNTFSYTGAFSVAAAIGGASSTTSVDLAKRSFPKTKEQFEVNNLDLTHQNIVVMDIFEYFRYAKRKELYFDLIILDPPSFARNKKQTFSVSKNYHELVFSASQLLTEDGILIASTNAANVSKQQFQEMIQKGFETANVRGDKIQDFSLPADFHVSSSFSEGNYLKVICYQIKKYK